MKNKIKNEAVNIEIIIDEWVLSLVRGTVFQTDTEMYNKLHAHVATLKQKLTPKTADSVKSGTDTSEVTLETSEIKN